MCAVNVERSVCLLPVDGGQRLIITSYVRRRTSAGKLRTFPRPLVARTELVREPFQKKMPRSTGTLLTGSMGVQRASSTYPRQSIPRLMESRPRFSRLRSEFSRVSKFDAWEKTQGGRLDFRRRAINRGHSGGIKIHVESAVPARCATSSDVSFTPESSRPSYAAPPFCHFACPCDVRELDWVQWRRNFWPAAWVRPPASKDAEERSIRCPCCNLWEKSSFAGTVQHEGAPGGHELTSLGEVIRSLIGARNRRSRHMREASFGRLKRCVVVC